MKKCTILFIYAALTLWFGMSKTQAQTCPPLLWADEFDGTTLNTANWNITIGNGCPELCSFGNNELQSYQAANVTVSGGTLKILAKVENINDRNYSSGKITSKDLAKFTYGRYEARIKLPKGNGLWPAFWMLSNDEPYGTWPKSGEIDIMEYVATNNDETLGYIHYGDFWPNNKNQGKKYKVSNTNLSDDFHVFAVEWEMNVIRWYIDGVLFSTKTNTDVAPSMWPFDHDMYMILNVAVGGNLGGAVTNSMLPATMEVDYVRVYGGNKPYLVGDNVVPNAATGKVYTLSQTASGSTINWTVPTGATIVNGQGTNSITVDFGSDNGIVMAQYNDNCNTNYNLTMPIKVENATTKCATFENFDEAGSLTVNTLTTGALTEEANPVANDPINGSALVGKYIRNGGEQYDVLFYNLSSIANANEYKDGTKKFYMDVYTAAPVGSEIYLQLETASSAPNNYPTGRHSRYIATVLETSKWHRLVFSLLDTPDAGAASTAITKMVILFKPNTFTNDSYYFDNLDSYCSAVVPPAMAKCSSFENFDDIATISEVFKTGVLAEVSNPLPADPINSTSKVGKYDRAGGSQYDVLIYNVSNISDGNEYKDGVKKFYMDVYTQAPIGSEIIVQLETSAASGGYPAGRHSRYNAFITDNSAWKRLEFTYIDQPDPTANPTDIKAIIVLFKPNTFTNDTYYFDNFDSYCVPEPPTLVKCGALENFDEAGVITAAFRTGELTEEANPSPLDPLNSTPLVGKYVRQASAAFDVLFYDVTTITNADEYKDGLKKFKMDVKTTAPIGTEIIIQLENNAATGANYPTGRHSRFRAFTTSNIAWQRLEFDYVDSPGGVVDPASITKMVILFKPGQNTGETYYFDNLDSYCLLPVSSSEVSGVILEDTNGGTIDGTPLSVGGTYISIFKSSNTSSTPDVTVPVAAGTGLYSIPDLPTGTYKLVITTNPAGSRTPSFPNIGGFSMKAGAEGETGTMGDGLADGMTTITVSLGSTIYAGARVMAPAGVSFALAQNSPLPIKLVSFTGKNTESGNLLNWKTSSEVNFSHFEVERSSLLAPKEGITGQKFEKIGQQKPNEFGNYEFLDSTPPLGAVGLYRLKMLDLDGSYTYSKIVSIINKTEKAIVGNFYPNPAKSQVNIDINATEAGNWVISTFDVTGKVIKTETQYLQKGVNKISIDKLVYGVNFVRFENKAVSEIRKVIVE